MQYDDERARALNYLINNSIIAGDGSDDDCREWQGPLTKQGYGQIGVEQVFQDFGIRGAHRLMTHLVSGHDFQSRDEQVLHECHNRRCINPSHLRIGTALENMEEMRAAGRSTGGNRFKLSADAVREMRTRRAAGERTMALAAEYGVHPNHASKIISRRARQDVE